MGIVSRIGMSVSQLLTNQCTFACFLLDIWICVLVSSKIKCQFGPKISLNSYGFACQFYRHIPGSFLIYLYRFACQFCQHIPGVLCPPHVYLMSFTGQVFPGLPCFDSSCTCTCSEGKPKNMNGGGQPPSTPPLFKQGRPGSIHHVSGRKVDLGGEGPIFKFLTSQDEQFRSR